jgi:hypothetical protein
LYIVNDIAKLGSNDPNNFAGNGTLGPCIVYTKKYVITWNKVDAVAELLESGSNATITTLSANSDIPYRMQRNRIKSLLDWKNKPGPTIPIITNPIANITTKNRINQLRK